MLVNVSKELVKREFLDHFIIHLMAHYDPHNVSSFTTVDENGDHIVDIKLTFNGHDVDPLVFIAHLDKCFDDCVRAEAKSMLKARLNGLVDDIYAITDEVDELVQRLQVRRDYAWANPESNNEDNTSGS